MILSFVTSSSTNCDDTICLVCVVVTWSRKESFRLLVPLDEALALLSGIAVIGRIVEDSFFERLVRLVGRGRDLTNFLWSLLDRRNAHSLRDFPVILRRGALEAI